MIRMTLDLSPLGHALRELDQNLDEAFAEASAHFGDMVVDRARSYHDYTDHTFDLTGSIHAEPVTGTFTGGDLDVAVVADAPYAKFVEDGTVEHEIRPRRRKALRFQSPSDFRRFIFRKSVHHPGTKPRYFLKGALEHVFPQTVARSTQALRRAFKKSGFEVA